MVCPGLRDLPFVLSHPAMVASRFLNSFESQRHAEFPAYEIQGPFCAMSQRVQVEQYDIIETCLGRLAELMDGMDGQVGKGI